MLDDVWRREDIEPFLVEGAESHVVFTTRDRTIAVNVGAQEVEIGSMAPAEALQLLREWTGRDDAGYPAVASRLGYHPLALRLTGVRLREPGMTAARWLDEFSKLSHLGGAGQSRDDDLQISLRTTTERLREDDRQFYYSLGIFPFQVRVPEHTILRFWRQMGRSAAEARLLLAEFERFALVDWDGQTVWLHDLLRTYAREQLADSARSLHERLLHAYGATDVEHVPPAADSYYLRYSSYHFREARLVRRGFSAKFDEHDILGWMLSILRWRTERHPLKRPSSAEPAQLPARTRVAVLGNWGIGLYGAPVAAQSLLSSSPYDLLLHLGGIFYSGTEQAVRERFLRFWPTNAATLSRALNGNHEMYSGGDGYFAHLLPALGQTSSYFAFANEHWILIALDTAYVDADVDQEQLAWLKQVLSWAGNRKVALFSRHYLFSAIEHPAPKLREKVGPLLSRVPGAVWYWSHEMRCVLFDPYEPYGGLLARSVGHGGFPTRRPPKVRSAPAEKVLDGVEWKRLQATASSPPCLVLDGPNPYLVGREERYAPHGYMTLEFDGPRLTERVYLADGTLALLNEVS